MSKEARRISERLQDMRQAIEHIRSDLGDLQRNGFMHDGKTQRAVVESLIVIGEAANSILRADQALERSHPELWQHLRDA